MSDVISACIGRCTYRHLGPAEGSSRCALARVGRDRWRGNIISTFAAGCSLTADVDTFTDVAGGF